MNTKQLLLLVVSVVVALSFVLGGCSPAPASSATFEAAAVAPEQVVERFYDGYLGYPGNVLVDGAYRSSEYLAEEFVQKVDKIIASFEKGGYDPFLYTQSVPGSVRV